MVTDNTAAVEENVSTTTTADTRAAVENNNNDIDIKESSEVDNSKDNDAFITSIPQGEDNDEESDFYEDIGYNKLIKELQSTSSTDQNNDILKKINEKVSACRQLEQSIREQAAELSAAKQKTTTLQQKDAEQQKQSDEVLESIHKMEETALRINNEIPNHEKHINELASELEQNKVRIEQGPGPTDEQQLKKTTLSNALECSRTNATENNIRLNTLRSNIKEMESEVETSIKQRDESLASLETVSSNLCNAKEQQQETAAKVKEVERSKEILVETLHVAQSELVDAKNEHDSEQKALQRVEEEVEELRVSQQNCSNEYEVLGKKEDAVVKELKSIQLSNKDIEVGNSNEQKQLDMISKERDCLDKERAKASKLRELIAAKTNTTDKERAQYQKEVDTLSSNIAKVENDIPMLQKDVDVVKRDIKRSDHEFDMVSRKIGLTKRGSSRVQDILRSNENTLLTQQTELIGIKKAMKELQKAREILVAEESRDQGQLKRIFEVLQKKQSTLTSQAESNRLLEVDVAKAEAQMSESQAQCDNARKAQSLETVTLIRLRENINVAKTELQTLMVQVKIIKDEISRYDDLCFKEHVHHSQINTEKLSIQSDITSFDIKTAKLEQEKVRNEFVIVKLGHDIDEQETEKELLRRQCRQIMSKKDIISAHMLAAEAELQKFTVDRVKADTSTAMSRYNELQNELNIAKETSCDLENQRQSMIELKRGQIERKEILAALENDLTRQRDKNSALTVEIGRPINLHRWRYMKDQDPERYLLLERVHDLQRKAISATDRIAAKTSKHDEKKRQLSKLTNDVSSQQNVDEMKLHLLGLKSKLKSLSNETKSSERELLARIEEAAQIKLDVIKLEKESIHKKADYLVSVITGH